tara:strand:+ start:1016 stop:1276 length:261 start_codon:yes stop_codon:yes gene_type:complete
MMKFPIIIVDTRSKKRIVLLGSDATLFLDQFQNQIEDLIKGEFHFNLDTLLAILTRHPQFFVELDKIMEEASFDGLIKQAKDLPEN